MPAVATALGSLVHHHITQHKTAIRHVSILTKLATTLLLFLAWPAVTGLTVMVHIMAQGSNQQHQLVHSGQAFGHLAAHDEHVGAVQHIYHMAEVVVGVLVVVAADCCNEGHDLALLHAEELHHATVCKDVIHHLDLQSMQGSV